MRRMGKMIPHDVIKGFNEPNTIAKMFMAKGWLGSHWKQLFRITIIALSAIGT